MDTETISIVSAETVIVAAPSVRAVAAVVGSLSVVVAVAFAVAACDVRVRRVTVSVTPSLDVTVPLCSLRSVSFGGAEDVPLIV